MNEVIHWKLLSFRFHSTIHLNWEHPIVGGNTTFLRPMVYNRNTYTTGRGPHPCALMKDVTVFKQSFADAPEVLRRRSSASSWDWRLGERLAFVGEMGAGWGRKERQGKRPSLALWLLAGTTILHGSVQAKLTWEGGGREDRFLSSPLCSHTLWEAMGTFSGEGLERLNSMWPLCPEALLHPFLSRPGVPVCEEWCVGGNKLCSISS